jgi:hypothetical protein
LFLYTVVPVTTLLSFICLALVPTLVFPTQTHSSLFPYPPYLPFPVLEALTATALWSLSYLLRDFLYATTLFIVSPLSSSAIISTILSATLQTTSNLLLRQIAIPILLIPYYSIKHHPTWKDDAFKRVWWVALGWAAAEAVVGVKQGYESIALYKDVLVSVVDMSTLNTQRERLAAPQRQNHDEREDDSLSIGSNHNIITEEDFPPPISDEHQPLLRTMTKLDDRLQAENDVERDLDQLIALKNREELEEVYGIPVIVTVFFICLLHCNLSETRYLARPRVHLKFA